MWSTRPYQPSDRPAVTALADRLTIGAPPWRDPNLWLPAVRGWVDEAIRADGENMHALFVTTSENRVAGFVSVSTRQHFTGARDAYIGELVVAAWAEGLGAGQELLDTAEQWAVRNGLNRLTLETGAANHRALAFYGRAGFQSEDVRLTKLLD